MKRFTPEEDELLIILYNELDPKNSPENNKKNKIWKVMRELWNERFLERFPQTKTFIIRNQEALRNRYSYLYKNSKGYK